MAQSNLRVVENSMDKNKALDAALSQIERAFGKGSIMKLGASTALEIEAISTGSLGLDIALGIGGLPTGPRRRDLRAGILRQDHAGAADHRRSPEARRHLRLRRRRTCAGSGLCPKLGVKIDDLLISQPDTGEQALEIADTLVRSGAVEVLVIDSVAALTPRAELEGEMGDQLPGLQARLMSQALRKLTGSISKTNCMVIFINQIRMKIGVMFGSPETTTGGNALKFYASVRLDIRRIGAIKDRDEVVGNQTRVKVVKNKVAPPFKQVEFDIMYGEGISKVGELVDLGVTAGVVEKSGSWFSYNGERIGQGRENAKNFLRQNPDMANAIEADDPLQCRHPRRRPEPRLPRRTRPPRTTERRRRAAFQTPDALPKGVRSHTVLPHTAWQTAPSASPRRAFVRLMFSMLRSPRHACGTLEGIDVACNSGQGGPRPLRPPAIPFNSLPGVT